jgi:hypothetical protein
MSTPDLNVVKGALLDIGYAGQVADMQDSEIESLKNTAATAIDFAYAVARGTGDNSCKAIAVDGDTPIGISVRYPIRPADSTGVVKYAQNDSVPVMRRGNIFAIAYENAAAGDAVISVTAQGGKLGSTTGGAAGTGRVAINGAYWQGAVTAGSIGKIRINNQS